jgi:L-cysteine S-thiosulfotransferase
MCLSVAAVIIGFPSGTSASECKLKTNGYFQQMDAASRVALVPQKIPGIARSLTGQNGDPVRGRAVVLDPEKGNCIMCHRIASLGDEMQQGNVGPNLSDVGTRITEDQLRQRIVDPRVISPTTIMPSFLSAERFERVSKDVAGTSILTPAEIEDVITYLKNLK